MTDFASFKEIKKVLSTIKTKEDFNENLDILLYHLSMIGKYYLNINLKKNLLQNELDTLRKRTRESYEDNLITTYALKRCPIDSLDLDDLEKNLDILPLEEFYEQKGITKEEIQNLTKNQLLKMRFGFEKDRYEKLVKKHKELEGEDRELKANIRNATRLFDTITPKIRNLQAEINNSLNNKK